MNSIIKIVCFLLTLLIIRPLTTEALVANKILKSVPNANQLIDTLPSKIQNAGIRKLYAIIYSPGKKYDTNKTVYKQDLKEHGLYLQQLSDNGTLVLAGPFTNDAGGMLIIRASDEAAALNIANKDPAVFNQVFIYKMTVWDIRFNTIKL